MSGTLLASSDKCSEGIVVGFKRKFKRVLEIELNQCLTPLMLLWRQAARCCVLVCLLSACGCHPAGRTESCLVRACRTGLECITWSHIGRRVSSCEISCRSHQDCPAGLICNLLPLPDSLGKVCTQPRPCQRDDACNPGLICDVKNQQCTLPAARSR